MEHLQILLHHLSILSLQVATVQQSFKKVACVIIFLYYLSAQDTYFDY